MFVGVVLALAHLQTAHICLVFCVEYYALAYASCKSFVQWTMMFRVYPHAKNVQLRMPLYIVDIDFKVL